LRKLGEGSECFNVAFAVDEEGRRKRGLGIKPCFGAVAKFNNATCVGFIVGVMKLFPDHEAKFHGKFWKLWDVFARLISGLSSVEMHTLPLIFSILELLCSEWTSRKSSRRSILI
jgi:hypothetical protein